MRTIAFVFARGGSKGIPRKNLRTVKGVPLVVWAIRAAQACPEVDAVVVSTDDEEIAELSASAGAEVPSLRPSALATDEAPEIEAWVHALSWFSDLDGNPEFDEFVSVPATSPLREPDDITSCIRAYRSGGCDLVITGSPSTHHPSFSMVQVCDDGLARLVEGTSATGAGSVLDSVPDWERAVLSPSATLREAIENLNSTGAQIVLIAESHDALVGVVTDGDIRRCLLRTPDLDQSLSAAVVTHPIVIGPDGDWDRAVELLRAGRLRHLPEVDTDGHLVGLHALPQNLATRRQETEGMFDVSCVAYVTSPQYILETPSIMAGRLKLVDIPRERTLDIDDEFDLRIAELLCRTRDEIEWL